MACARSAAAGSGVDTYHRNEGHDDRILCGAKPGDLAIRQPTKFEVVVTLKAANAYHLARGAAGCRRLHRRRIKRAALSFVLIVMTDPVLSPVALVAPLGHEIEEVIGAV